MSAFGRKAGTIDIAGRAATPGMRGRPKPLPNLISAMISVAGWS